MNRLQIWTLAVVAAVAAPVAAQDVIIRITGNGGTAKYVKDGATMQEDVEVAVGQTVRWINAGNMKHTATSVKKDTAGNRIFDTGDITQTAPNNFKEIVFSEALFKSAGGTAGSSVELEYFCSRHPTLMKSKIILKSTAPTEAASLRVRKKIESLSAAELAALRQGVAVMKSRDPSDPRSWAFQANMHGVPVGGPSHPMFSQCQHGTPHFLTWHRGYLYYFERILREAAGDPSLTLPYWNWSSQRSVPLSYRQPADSTNSLFHERALNNGAKLPLSVVVTEVDNAQSEPLFMDFSSALEMPHGNVHTLVGGGGDMAFISTSARDPIFWLHHANVDRNWDRWLSGSGHANPGNSAFLAKMFTYIDETGAEVTVTVQQILNSTQLGYRYDDVPPVPTPIPVPELAAAGPEHSGDVHAETESSHAEHAALPTGALVASSQPVDAPESAAGVKLSFEPKSVALAFRESGHATLESAAVPAAGAPSKVVIEVVGVKAEAPPSFVYGVYINLPGDASNEQLSRHFVGSLDLFGVAEHSEEHAARPQRFDITGKLRRLGLLNAAAPPPVNVTIRPILPEPSDNESAVNEATYKNSAEAAKVEFVRVDLRVVPAAPAATGPAEKPAARPKPVVPKRVSLPLPPREEPESAVAATAAADPEGAVHSLIERRAALVRELGQLDVHISRTLESICGASTDFQDVERYDGSLGVPVALVRDHERAVGQLQWLGDLADRFDGPNDSPGNVNGQRWGSGGMLSPDLFITAGHCFDNSGENGWDMPFRNNIVIAPPEIATLMNVNFLYQINSTTGLRRPVESFPVLELLEYRKGGNDYAIVRLGPNADGELPGNKYGQLQVATADLLTPGAMLCLIQHPNGLPKKIEAGPMEANDGNFMSYASLDTLGGSSGAPILSLEGTLVGVHTNGGCTEFGGSNRGVSIGAIRRVSTRLP
ncbi:MAG: tyrosinase family protein [Planctomycetaceae bacterium]